MWEFENSPARWVLRNGEWRASVEWVLQSSDISTTVAALHKDGYTIFLCVEVFLQSFGNLSIIATRPHPCFGEITIDMLIDPVSSAEGIDPQWITYYIETIHTPLCPIGRVDHGHETLMMSPNGDVYGAFDELVMYFGKPVIAAIDRISMREDFCIIGDAYGVIVNKWYDKKE